MMDELRKKLEEETLPTLSEDAMDIDEEEDPVTPNLEAVATVLETLRGLGANNGSAMVATKVPVETSAALLGDFFGVSQVLLRRTLSVQTSWVENFLWLWRSSVWGNSNIKKISTSWSEKCLQPASVLLIDNRTPGSLKLILEEMLSEYIFPSNILQPTQVGNSKNPSKPSTNELTALLRPLRCESTAVPEKANTTSQFHLPVMFKVALKTLQRKQHAKPDPETVETVYRALLSAVLDLDLSTNAQVSQEGYCQSQPYAQQHSLEHRRTSATK
ncbi:hypothetical protein EX30DRAFT_31974 [Ascodesmis nigricans]|uniref:Uncharacterized protein n=1 Tax=Ascodesmis nigricans TaxID=341454 RepID=A0A4S2N8L4_9PEZI|nr:hypothetical protein EX30DRAFT_31974 [Ascodesmis nigricans]